VSLLEMCSKVALDVRPTIRFQCMVGGWSASFACCNSGELPHFVQRGLQCFYLITHQSSLEWDSLDPLKMRGTVVLLL